MPAAIESGSNPSPDKGKSVGSCYAESEDSLFSSFAAAQEARIKAHDAYLRFSRPGRRFHGRQP